MLSQRVSRRSNSINQATDTDNGGPKACGPERFQLSEKQTREPRSFGMNSRSENEVLGVSTGLLTVFALAASSKFWIASLPVLLVLDIVDELCAPSKSGVAERKFASVCPACARDVKSF